jgi:hypothetical protein
MMTSSAGCVDRVITKGDPLGGFSSEEAMCQQYCEVLDTCGHYDREWCLGDCIHPRDRWPWLTDECLDLRRKMIVCYAGYTCESYDNRGREGDPCVDEWYNWEAAGYECFGQYTESDGWQGGSSQGE